MNKYELALIVNASVDEEARKATFDQVNELIARFGGKVVDAAVGPERDGVVDEAVQRSVSSGDHNPVIVPEGTKEGSVIIDFRDIAEQQPVVKRRQRVKREAGAVDGGDSEIGGEPDDPSGQPP